MDKLNENDSSGKRPYKYNPKPEFEARMNALLGNEEDKKAFWKIVHTEPINSIRCNTLKINPKELKKRLEGKGWKINQPYSKHEEIMVIESNLMPGELGRSMEHILGYYYVQEISSMMPILALNPGEGDSFVDVCASPGSKTTQAAALMNNGGNIIANDNQMSRLAILASNLEKCGVSNTVVTRRDGVRLCKDLGKMGFEVSKILADVPCSGEGTLRSSPKTFVMWNMKTVENLGRQQKVIAAAALELLDVGSEMIYSTCTHAPEENEAVVDFLINNFDIKIENVRDLLPLKTREGVSEWLDKKYSEEVKKCARIYPQDNDTEGFFLCKIKKLSNKKFSDESGDRYSELNEGDEE